MTTKLNQLFTASLRQENERFPNDLLAFRNQLIDVHTFPYAAGALAAVNVLRFAPAAIAVISYFAS